MVNFGRHAFDLSAHDPATWPIPVGAAPSAAGGTLAITFTRRASGADLNYVVEASGDLVHWDTVATVAPGLPASVTIEDTAASGPEAPRRFMRVRAVSVP